MSVGIPEHLRPEIEALWDFHQMHHSLHRADIGIGLGSHDPSVPVVAVELFRAGLVPRVIFTGANAPTTIQRYPRGEAVHYGEYAVQHGIPEERVLLETEARSTPENITLTRAKLAAHGLTPSSAIVMSRPYQQRRAYTICAKLWPELNVTCASTGLPLDEYVAMIGEPDRVINMMVGDLQRLELDFQTGMAIETNVPPAVISSYERLIQAGYTSRLVAL